jgi:multidrug efflux system outer membrane protein
MPSLSTTIPMSRPAGSRTRQPAGLSTPVFVATLAASIALGLTGCSTPAAHPAVDVPPAFAAAQASDMEPEAAWWETFHDPVLTDLVRRAARENRDIKIAAERLRAARSGVTVSRSFLMPSVSAVGAAGDRSSGFNNGVKQSMPDTKTGSAPRCLVGGRLSGRLRAGAAAARPTRWPRSTACAACACW